MNALEKDMYCFNCRCWERSGKGDEMHGACHRFPPKSPDNLFPSTFMDDWCFEFIPNYPSIDYKY